MRVIITDYNYYMDEPKGKQEKGWIIIDGVRYLFKKASTKQNSDEVYNDVSECIASDCASLLGVDTAKYILCTLEGEKGVISKDFLDNTDGSMKKEELIDGVTLIEQIDPEFKNKQLINPKTHQYYTVSLLLDSVSKYGLIDDALNMIIFDALIGNRDRNPSNYGIIINHETNQTRFAPLFDSCTSFGMSMVQHRFDKCYREENGKAVVADEEHLSTVIHDHIVGKVTLDRSLQRKEKDAWDRKQIELINEQASEEKKRLSILLLENKITLDFYHKQISNIYKQTKKFDITTVQYKPLIEYLTTFYPNEIENIVERIKKFMTEENIDKIFEKYRDEVPVSRLEFAKRLLKERSSWMVDYYYKNRKESRGISK